MGYRFLKSNPKDNNINNNEHILMSLTLIKIIFRCVNLGFNILFCDETGLSNKNNNFHSWRKKNETIYQKYDKLKRKNLIMTVSKDDNIFHEIYEQTIDSKNFLNYMKNLKKNIRRKRIKKLYYSDG